MDKTVLKQTEKCLKRWIKEKHIGFTTALLVGFLISGEIVVGASEIQRTGDETKLSPTDSRFEIYAEKVNGENAFNRFGKFSLGENEIANLYFKEGADKPEASNLFNFVREKISVDGTVNAVRDGKIGGNLYFLSPEGMIIGTKGVVNTGSFYMITPEGDKFDAAMANAQNGTLSSGIVPDSTGNVNIPLNPEGTITVRGKIFATDDISLHAAKITIGDSSDTFETATSGTNKGKRTNKTAVLKTGVTNFGSVDGFGNVVNIADIASSGLETGALTATRTPGKGNITLAARAVKAKSTQIVDDIVNDGNFGNVDELIRHEIKAEVDSYGTLDAAGNVNISAIATNGDYLKTELGRELYDTEYSIADVKASVNIHDGSIDGEDVDISARAVNFYDTPDSVKWGSFAVTNLLGSTTPFNFGGALALLSAESDVNVKQSVWITARENLKLESKSDAYAILGASTALFKGNNYYLKGANAIPSLALAYVKMDVDADLTIEGTLTAAKALTAEAKASNEMKAAATESTIANDAQFGVAVLISQNTNHAKVDVTDTAKLESAGAMTIESTATNSITSEAEAKLGDSGVATVTVNYSEYESSADINIAGKLETKGTAADLTVSAVNRTTDNEILTTSTDGLSKFNQKIRGSGSGVGQILDTLKSKMNAEKSESKTEFLNMLKAGAAVTVVDHKNTADVTIKGSADLKSTGNLEVSAQNTVEDVHMETASDVFTTQKDDPDKVAVSAGVAVVDIENTANVTVENDAKFNADKDITLESAVNMEYRRVERMAKELTDSFNAIGDSAELLPENLKSEFEGIKSMFESFWNQVSGTTDALVSGEIFEIDIPGESGGKKSGSAMELLGYITGEASGFFEKIGVQIDALTEEKSPTYDDTTPTFYMLTALKDTLSRATSFASPGSYANFNTRSSTDAGDNDTKGLAGAVSYIALDNKSKVSVGKNVTINATGNIAVTSANKTDTVTIGGNASSLFLPMGTKGSAAGGTVNILKFDTAALVNVAEKASLTGNDVRIAANSDIFNVTAALSAGTGSSVLSGMVNYTSGSSVNQVSVDDEAILNGKNITLGADNHTSVTNVAGSVAYGDGAAAVGIAVAVNDFELTNKAAIEDNDEENDGSSYTKNSGTVTVTADNLSVTAKTTGTINSVSVAGGVTATGSDGKPGIGAKLSGYKNKIMNGAAGLISMVPDKIAGYLAKDQSATGAGDQGASNEQGSTSGNKTPEVSIAAAGSSSVNLVDNTTSALIDGANIKLNAENNGIVVEAADSGFIGAWSGAAAIQWQHISENDTTSVAVEGAIAYNDLNHVTTAELKNSTVTDAKKIAVNALSGGTQIAAGLGLAATKHSGDKGGSYQVGAAVSMNFIDHTVKALMSQNTVSNANGTTDIDVAAYESDIQVTGGVNIQAGKSKGSLGAAVSVADIKNDISAAIEGGTYSNIGTAEVKGLLATTQVTAGLSVGVTSSEGGVGSFEGAAAVNKLTNNVSATIDGATVSASEKVGVLATDVRASDASVSGYEAELKKKDATYAQDRGIDTTGESYYSNLEMDEDGLFDSIDGAVIVSAAAAVSASNEGAVGAGVAVDLINNEFSAQIKNGADVSAENVSVLADSDTLIVNAAMGVAVSKDKFGGMGSVAWQELSNNTKAIAENAAIHADELKIQAENMSRGINIGGQVAVGSKAGVGFVLAYQDIDNTTGAYSLGADLDVFTTDAGIAVDLRALNQSEVYNVAFGVAASTKVGIAGSVAISEGTNDTAAVVDEYRTEGQAEGAGRKGEIRNAKTVAVEALDRTKVRTIAGSVAAAGKAAIGGAVAYSALNGVSGENHGTYAALNHSDILTKSGSGIEISVAADDESDQITIAAGVGAAGNVAVQGSVATAVREQSVKAEMKDTNINETETTNKTGDLQVAGNNKSKLTTNASVVAASGTASIGAGVSVNKIKLNTQAVISGGTQNVKNALVESASSPEILTIGIGGAASGTVAVAGSSTTNLITSNTSAEIKDGAVMNASGNVGVIAQSDELIENYVGTVAGAGTAAVGISVAVNEISGNTTAAVSGSGTSVTADGSLSDTIETKGTVSGVVDNLFEDVSEDLSDKRQSTQKKGIVVDSSATHNIKSVLVTAGGAGTAAVMGTVNVNTIEGTTEAKVENATLNGGNVSVHAGDYTNAIGIVGAAAIGGNVGIGAASDTNVVERNTFATVKDAAIEGADIVIDADAKQGISSFTAGVAGTMSGAGVAGTVSVALLTGKTKTVADNAQIEGANVSIGANHEGKISVGNAALGVAVTGAGVGAAVAVVRDESETTTLVTGGEVKATGDLSVTSENLTKVRDYIASTGVGGIGAGVGATVSVNNIKALVGTSVSNAKLTSTKGDIRITADNKIDALMLSAAAGGGLAGVGAVISVNTVDSTVLTTIAGSTITASEGKIEISAEEERDILQIVGSVAVGGGALSVNVMVNNFGTAVLNPTDANGNTVDLIGQIKDINDELDIGAELGGNVADSGIRISLSNSSLSANTVDISVTETDALDMRGGGAAVGAVAAMGSVGVVNIQRNTGISIANTTVSATNALNIQNIITGGAEMDIYQGSIGYLSFNTAWGQIGIEGEAGISISGNSSLSGKNIAVGVKDESELESYVYGLSAGVVTAGFFYNKAENNGKTSVEITNSTWNANEKLEITAEKANKVTAESYAGMVGLGGINAVVARAMDNGESKIAVSGVNSFTAKDIALNAINKMRVRAKVGSVSVTAAAGFGASVSEALAGGKATLTVGDNNSFTVDRLTLGAVIGTTDDQDGTAKAETLSLGAAGLVGAQASVATAETEGDVAITVGKQDYNGKSAAYVRSIDIEGSNSAKAAAVTKSLDIAGIFSAGATYAETQNTGSTTVSVAGDVAANEITAGTVTVEAVTNAESEIDLEGYGGGIAGSVGAAVAQNTTDTTTTVNLSGNWNVASSLNAVASDKNSADIRVDAARAAVGASVSGIFIENTIGKTDESGNITSNTAVNLANGTKISGTGSVFLNALNDISVDIDADGMSFGLAAAAGNFVDNTVAKSTSVNLGNAQIITDLSQIYEAKTKADLEVYSKIISGGFVGGAMADTDNTLKTANTVTLAGGTLRTNKSDQDITLAASDTIKGDIEAIGDSGGLGGAVSTDVDNVVERTNTISVNGTIRSTNDVNLYASMDKAGRQSEMDYKILSHAYFYGVIAIADPALESDITLKNQVSTAAGTVVESVRDININANSGANAIDEAVQKYTWYDEEQSSNYAATENGEKNSNIKTAQNEVNLLGTLTAGIQYKQSVTINGIVDLNLNNPGVNGKVTDAGVQDAPTLVYGAETNNPSVETGMEDYANSLLTRYNEIIELLDSYTDSTSPAYVGYMAEKDRILNTMKDLQLVVEVEGTMIPVNGLQIQYVKIGDIVASGGNITIKSDTLNKDGATLTAHGNPTVDIINNSNLYLKVGDVEIKEIGGKITHNTLVLSDESTSAVPQINIRNTWTGTVTISGTEDNTTVSESVKPLTTVEITGNIKNLIGDVNISNTSGDILIQSESANTGASVTAGRNLNLDAPNGSVIQAYSAGVINIGAAPEAVWGDLASTKKKEAYDSYTAAQLASNQDKQLTSESLGTPGDADSGIKAGGMVFINAETINVGGNIQSGVEKYAVTIDASLNTKIAQYDAQWAVRKEPVTQSVLTQNYVLIEGGFQYDSATGTFWYRPSVYYDPSTRQAVIEDINVGGGKVYLTGCIISTGNGKIYAMDGAAQIEVTNNSSVGLRVGTINNNDVQGLVSITDTYKKITTEYTRDKTTVTNYGTGASPVQTTNSGALSYTPETGLRYNWTEGTESTTRSTYRYSQDFYGWGLIKMDWEDLVTNSKGNLINTVNRGESGKPVGSFVSMDTANKDHVYTLDFHNTLTGETSVSNPREWRNYDNWTHFSGTQYAEWTVTKGNEQTYTHSVKADNAIGIAFIGSRDGEITITSGTGIQLDGAVKNAAQAGGTATTSITSENGGISQTRGIVTADILTLHAKGDIQGVNGNDALQISGRDGAVTLDVVSSAGNVQIAARSAVIVDKAQGKDVVSLSAYGDLTQKSAAGSSVEANRINLVSETGRINLIVKAGTTLPDARDSLSASLNAQANGNITLTQATGNMRIGRIYSAGGDVSLTTSGYLIDALPTGESDGFSQADMIERWKKAGLLEEDGGKWKLEELLYAIQDAIVNPETGSTQNEVKDPNITGRNITINAYGLGEDRDAETIDLKTLTDNDYANMKRLASAEASDVVWDTATGTATITPKHPIGIQQTGDSGQITITTTDNVYLTARTVGDENAGDNTLRINNITAGNGNIRLQGTGGLVNAAGTDDVNLKGKDLILEGGTKSIGDTDKSVNIEISGILTARSDKSIYIRQLGTKALNIASIYAGEDIGLASGGALYRKELNDTLDATSRITAGSGHSITLAAGGDIGKEDQRIQIKNTGSLVNISATGDIWLAGVEGGTLALNDVSAGAEKKLDAISEDDLKTTGDLSAKEIKLAAKNDLTLADGSVSASAKLTLISDKGAISQDEAVIKISALSAAADKGIALGNAANELNSAVLANTTGDVILRNSGANGLTFSLTGGINQGNISVANEKGALSVQTDLYAQGADYSVILTSDGNITAKNLSAGQNVGASSLNGNVEAEEIAAGEDVTLSARGDIGTDKITAGHDATLTAGNDIASDSIKTGNDATLTAGRDIAADVEAGHDATLIAGNKIESGAISAGNDAMLTAENDIAVDTVVADHDAVLVAIAGSIETKRIEAGNKVDLTAGTDIAGVLITAGTDAILAAGNDIASKTIETGADAILVAKNDITSDRIVVSNDAKLTADGNIESTTITADNDVKLTAEGNIESATITADHDVVLTADGDIKSTTITSGNDATLTAKGDITSDKVEATKKVTLDGTNIVSKTIKAGTDAILTAKNDITSTTITADNVAVLTAKNNITSDKVEATKKVTFEGTNIDSKTIKAGTDAVLTAKNDITSDSITVENNAVLTADGDIKSTTITAGNDATLTAKGDITSDKAEATQKVTLDGTNIDSKTIKAGTDALLTAKNDINSTTINVGNDAVLTAKNDITGGNITAGRDAKLTADHDIIANNIATGRDANLTAQNNVTGNIFDAGNDVNITAGENLTAWDIMAVRDINLSARNIRIGSAKAGNDAALAAGNDIVSESITAGVNATLAAGNDITSGSLTTGTDAILTAQHDIMSDTIEAGNDATLTAQHDITSDTIKAGNDATLTAQRDIATNAITAGVDVTLAAGSDITSGSLTTGSDATLTAQHDITSDTIKAGNDATLTAQRDIASNAITTGVDATLAAGNDITSGSLTTGSDATLTAQRDITSDTIKAGNDATLTAQHDIATNAITTGVDVTLVAGNDITSGSLTTGNDATLTAQHDITSDTIKAGTDATLTAQHDITSDTIKAGTDATLTAQHNITSGTVSAGNDVELSTQTGNLSANTVTAGNEAVVTTNNGDINLHDLTAQNNAHIESKTSGAITSGGTLTSATESIVVISGNGDVDLGSIYGHKAVQVTARDGNVVIGTVNGETIIVSVLNINKKTDIENIIAGKAVIITSDDISTDDLTQRSGYDNAIVFTPRNPDPTKPISNFDLGVTMTNPFIIDELWVKNARVFMNGIRLELPKLRVTDTGYFSNSMTAVTVHGADRGPDDSDVNLWNDATNDNKWITLLFQEGKNRIYSDGVLLRNMDFYHTYDQRFSAIDVMIKTLNDFYEEQEIRMETLIPGGYWNSGGKSEGIEVKIDWDEWEKNLQTMIKAGD